MSRNISWDCRNHVALGKFPGFGNLIETIRVDFDLTGRCFKRICLRIFSKGRQTDSILLPIVDLLRTFLPEDFPFRKLRNFLTSFVVAPFEPLILSSAFSEFLFFTKFFGDQSADFIRSLLIPLRLNGLSIGRIELVAPLELPPQADIVCFRTHNVRKQDIGITAGRRHHVVADDNKFALRSIFQNLIGRIGVCVLVDHGVAARVHNHLDVVIRAS